MQQQLKRVNSEISSKSELKAINFGFYKPIKKNKLRNFDATIVLEIMKVNGKDIAIKNDREKFSRLLVIQRTNEIYIMEVLRHELSSVPLAVYNLDNASTSCKMVLI